MILKARAAKMAAVAAVVSSTCLAGEYAVLVTGFRIHADRHESDGRVVRLYANGGSTELAAALVTRFEADGEPVKTPPPAPEKQPTPEQLVNAAAERNGLPPDFVRSVVAVESGYRPDAVSRKGAIGLMQLMPATARAYGADPNDPKQNVEAGTKYLRDLLVKYDGRVSHALAAYNAGPGAVDRHHGVPPYRETLAYIERVIRKYEKKGDAGAKPPAANKQQRLSYFLKNS